MIHYDPTEIPDTTTDLAPPTAVSPVIGHVGSTIGELADRVFAVTDIKNSTKQTYRYGVRDFASWNVAGTLDATTLIRYKKHLRERADLSTSTKNLYLSGVRVLVRRMFELGLAERDLGKGVKGFSVSRQHKRAAISDTQVEKVFRYLRQNPDKRLILVFTLMYYQGLRQKEVLDLRVEDFDSTGMTLNILGKGRDDREKIDLHPKTVEAIRRFIAQAELKSGYLFISRKNPSAPISRIQLGRLIRAVHRECEVANTGHSWRKVFTSKLIDGGMDLLTVSSFTRHKSIQQLQTYYDRIERTKKLPRYYQLFDATG
jgi:integrase/recombinase XerC